MSACRNSPFSSLLAALNFKFVARSKKKRVQVGMEYTDPATQTCLPKYLKPILAVMPAYLLFTRNEQELENLSRRLVCSRVSIFAVSISYLISCLSKRTQKHYGYSIKSLVSIFFKYLKFPKVLHWKRFLIIERAIWVMFSVVRD